MKKMYIYAISIVSERNGKINNMLYNGISDKGEVVAAINSMVDNYDDYFFNNIVLVNCNIAEMSNNGKKHQFNRGYEHSSLLSCLKNLASDVEDTLQ